MLEFVKYFPVYWDDCVALFFIVDMIFYTDWFWMLNQSFIPGINPSWLWCIILFICCWIYCRLYIGLHPLYQFSSVQSLSRVWLFATPWSSPGQNTGVGSLSLLRGSSQPRNRTRVSCTVGRFFTNWAIWEALAYRMCAIITLWINE